LAVLSYYAPVPPSLDFAAAAALPAAIETATRALDQLDVGSGGAADPKFASKRVALLA
jgi:NADPH:quinone reductase-like Zn-dependent oxidoreductase